MTAYNVVRMRVKPGRETEFLKTFKDRDAAMAERMKANGLRKICVIKTGDRAFCIIGEWNDMSGIVAARPEMVKRLDEQRTLLEDLGGGLGVTDPVSGEVVVEEVDPPNKEGDDWMRDGVKKLDRKIRNPPIDPPDNNDPERKYPE